MLRKAHFSFGSKTPIPDLYTTTNRAVHNLNPSEYGNYAQKKVKIGKPPTHVVDGSDPTVYTSSSKDVMVEHSVKGQQAVQQQIKEQGLQVRKHNFHLGFDKDSHKPSLAAESTSDLSTVNLGIRNKNSSQLGSHAPTFKGNDNKKSNFEISYTKGDNDYISISKMAQLGL